jgi:hypothetical protein
MLEMIFANCDLQEFPEYYNISHQSQSQDNDKTQKYNVKVLINEYQHVINIDDEPDWGYYIDLDNTTPPNKKYSKNKNLPPTLNLPKKNYTINKPIHYLPPIEEEILHTNINIDTKSYIMDDISTTSSVLSSVTFCATIAFYYFFRNMRN